MYRIASASKYLVITGWGIPDVKLAKKSLVFPGQSCSVFDVSPVDYTFEILAISTDKLPYILPAVFTIGPRVDNEQALLKYAKLISSHDKHSNHTNEIVQGIIEGETRVLSASMTMEEIFKGTTEFKQELFEKVQLELNQFGLLIYNADVKQLVDVRGHEYFSYLGQKTQMEAANQAKIDVAEAWMKGEIGSKLRDGQTLQNAAKIDAETKIVATQRQGDGKKEEIRVKTDVKVYENQGEAEVAEANAELAKKKAGWAKEAQVAEMESVKADLIEAKLQTEVERMNAFTTTEKRRPEFLSKASVKYETKSVTTTCASEYLVITGLGIPDVKLAKKSWVFPGQSCIVFDVSPVNYTFEVQATSAEKLTCILPAVFTIGPRVDDEQALFKYAKLISSHKHSNHTKELVQRIIEEETRVLAASMTMEEIYNGTKEFKQVVSGKVQLKLNQFGLLIYNANERMKGEIGLKGRDLSSPDHQTAVACFDDDHHRDPQNWRSSDNEECDEATIMCLHKELSYMPQQGYFDYLLSNNNLMHSRSKAIQWLLKVSLSYTLKLLAI
ncbi:hypothetical protein LWI29_002418 [Acer saccharum]|uniref:Flotillin-like n=1 Tax=Acer saccharum TaxID=4024 RepID=A0AA39RBS8_ACESA|nr:hypothetical protein LWI29_002418 [Acer saccharum]